MAHVIQLALGAFKSSLGVKGRTRSWEAHECDQQFGKNESIDNGKSQRHREEGNTRINMVSAMGAGLAKIIGKVRTSRYFGSAETDLPTAENACCIDYANTWSTKRVCRPSKSQCQHCGTTNYECEDTLELVAGVTRGGLLITGSHMSVASKSKIQ